MPNYAGFQWVRAWQTPHIPKDQTPPAWLYIVCLTPQTITWMPLWEPQVQQLTEPHEHKIGHTANLPQRLAALQRQYPNAQLAALMPDHSTIIRHHYTGYTESEAELEFLNCNDILTSGIHQSLECVYA